ncbi:PREDICTED: uncharacterized protein K02A2.6-like [Vollenhovia emeryi]|uniref:uncharacterized protein K02A2.6-like n=1 Tax=Vollenhovia emeryi TaxID=411798 RepID=UPI0005F4DDC5|nr:PREDICTED: uncharacterized protein K02A2.6-like [Vollenhovia emeryi]
MPYSPKIVYKAGTTIPIPDALSRDCVNNEPDSKDDEELIVHLLLPMSTNAQTELQKAVKEDDELQMLKNTIEYGWPVEVKDVTAQLQKYWNYRDELSLYDGIIVKGDRPLIPATLRSKYLKIIHQGHLGIQSNLHRAREAIFWPQMTQDITDYANKCVICQTYQRANIKEPIQLHPIPNEAWNTVATDLFEIKGDMYILIVDSYSGFYDVVKLRTTTSESIMKILKHWFSLFGIPKKLISDNGPQFASSEFKKFARQWNFEHVTSSPGYPQSNGLAERPGLQSPAVRLFGKPTRTTLPTANTEKKTDTNKALEEARQKQKKYADRTRPGKLEVTPGENVRIRTGHRQWKGGTVVTHHEAPRSVIVKTSEGTVLRRNYSDVHRTAANMGENKQPSTAIPIGLEGPTNIDDQQPETKDTEATAGAGENTKVPTTTTRSGRAVRPPTRLNL